MFGAPLVFVGILLASGLGSGAGKGEGGEAAVGSP